MPSAYTASQKAAISQFVGFTSTKDSVAAKQLKQHNWNVEQAIDAFFQSPNAPTPASSATASLNKLFDKYRDNVVEEPDKIGVEGSMKYLGDLGVKLDEAAVLAVLTELNAPTMGEFTREGFLTGWMNNRADTLPKQQSQISHFRRSLPSSPAFFRKTYRSTFLLARLQGQKILPLETAIEYWRLLFTAPSLSWNTDSTPWLDWWIEFLETRWKKSISRDMWDQTGSFAVKCLEDEGMGWWSEEGAWPGVLDEFVGFVREKKGVREGEGEVGSEMDVG